MSEIMLENAPSDWPRKRLGQIFRERREKVNDKDFAPLSVTKWGILPQLETVAKTDDGDNRKGVRAGDFVINSRSDRKGSGGLSDRDGSVSPICIVLQAYDVNPRFAHHLLRSSAFQEEFYRWGCGIVADLWTTRYNEMRNICLAIPDRNTQKSIADFLDRETARIDLLIEKKKRLVELLAEKDRTSVREHVLGQRGERGRISNDTFWLPDIPSEWPVERCAHIFHNLDSRRIPLNSEERAILEGIYPYYGASGVIDFIDRFIFDGENILVGEDGANLVMKSTPIAFKASGRYWVNNHAHILHPRFGNLDYWIHVLNQVPYEIFVTGSAQPKLTSEALGNIRLPCPPSKEQDNIVAVLETERRALVALRDPINRSIDRLREFRAALVTAAVTGQIDVATWGWQGVTERRLDRIEEEISA